MSPACFFACIISVSAQASIRLTSTSPGPYAIVAYWGDNAGYQFEYVWDSTTNAALTQCGWQVIYLPDIKQDIDIPTLEIQTIPPVSPQPRIMLYAKGDPLTLIYDNRQIRLQGYVSEKQRSKARKELLRLPYSYKADIKIITPNESFIASAMVIKTKTGDTEKKVSSTPGSQNGSIMFRTIDQREAFLDIDQSKLTTTVTTQTEQFVLKPLFQKRKCVAPQSGIYAFETLNKKGKRLNIMARSLLAGESVYITAPDKVLIGPFAGFIPAGLPYASNLENDAFFSFSGFHAREESRGNIPPFQRWTAGNKAYINIIYPPDLPAVIDMSLAAHRPEQLTLGDVEIEVRGNKHTIDIRNETWTGRFHVPAADEDSIRINISSDTWNPARDIASRDSRELGIMLTGLTITPTTLQNYPLTEPQSLRED